MYSQEDFTWQEIWQTSIHFFKFHWNNRSVNYFVLLLWIQYHYINFKTFSCRILIILYKIVIIFEISNETRNKLTIDATLCRNVTIFYRQELAFLYPVQKKLEMCRSSKWNFSSSCFIADDSHVKIVWQNLYLPDQAVFIHDQKVCVTIC